MFTYLDILNKFIITLLVHFDLFLLLRTSTVVQLFTKKILDVIA